MSDYTRESVAETAWGSLEILESVIDYHLPPSGEVPSDVVLFSCFVTESIPSILVLLKEISRQSIASQSEAGRAYPRQYREPGGAGFGRGCPRRLTPREAPAPRATPRQDASGRDERGCVGRARIAFRTAEREIRCWHVLE